MLDVRSPAPCLGGDDRLTGIHTNSSASMVRSDRLPPDAMCERPISVSQYSASRISFRTSYVLWMKSARLSAPLDSW